MYETPFGALGWNAVVYVSAGERASPELAGDCNQHDFLRERVIRYVYANDIVPQLPPAESDPFAHFGTGYQYKRKGDKGSWQQNNAPRKQLRNLMHRHRVDARDGGQISTSVPTPAATAAW